MKTYKFKFHGVNDNKAVFSFINGEGWNHYKMYANGVIERISYADVDLALCNTTIQNVDGTIEKSKAHSVSYLASKGLLDTLIERDVHLEGIGDVADNDYFIMLPYAVKVELSNGITLEEIYSAINEKDALRIAEINNPLFKKGEVVV